MTDAAETLAATLVAAGWKALPPGHSWYAKRFAWEPAAAERAERAGQPRARPGPPAPVAARAVVRVIVLGTLAALQLSERR